jgi:hypothetical protein
MPKGQVQDVCLHEATLAGSHFRPAVLHDYCRTVNIARTSQTVPVSPKNSD